MLSIYCIRLPLLGSCDVARRPRPRRLARFHDPASDAWSARLTTGWHLIHSPILPPKNLRHHPRDTLGNLPRGTPPGHFTLRHERVALRRDCLDQPIHSHEVITVERGPLRLTEVSERPVLQRPRCMRAAERGADALDCRIPSGALICPPRVALALLEEIKQ